MHQQSHVMTQHYIQSPINMEKKPGLSHILALMNNPGQVLSDKATNSQLPDSDLTTELSLQLLLKISTHQ